LLRKLKKKAEELILMIKQKMSGTMTSMAILTKDIPQI
jgi:hypothetical protein